MSDPTLQEWADRLHGAAGGELRAALLRGLVGSALNAEGRAKENATARPRVRTDTLRRAITGTVGTNGEALELRLHTGGRTGGENVEYARAQEEGATITPKKGRWLTIPVGAAKTAGGDTRGSARMFPDLYFRFAKGRSDRAVLISPDLGVLFVLVKRVEIPATWFLRRAFETIPTEVEALMGSALTRVLP